MLKCIFSWAQTPFRSLFIPETTPIISKTSWILKFNVSLKWLFYSDLIWPFSDRISTFPISRQNDTSIHPTVAEFAECGFFHHSHSDQPAHTDIVSCFFWLVKNHKRLPNMRSLDCKLIGPNRSENEKIVLILFRSQWLWPTCDFSDFCLFFFVQNSRIWVLNQFFSGITLARWNPDDDVWMEHAKVSKELCGYLIYRKGLEYCEALRER